MRKCPNCGVEISEEARFCRKCGTKIEDPTTEEKDLVEETKEEPSAEESYEWGPPLGEEGGEETQEMMPVQFTGPGTSIEEYEDDEYGYEEEEYADPWDHTREFDPQDISENKVMALAAYVLGPIGIIIALLAAQNSPYAGFHVRQSLKIAIVEALVIVIMTVLCWTLIVPAAGAIFLLILLVVRVIAFVSACKGKAVEPPIVRGLGFMK